jgi:hypothetical protein
MTAIWRLFARFGAQRRFWKRAEVGAPGDCWPWTGPTGADGLPAFDGRPAAVAAYEQARGPVPEGARVTHRCGNPRCLNPDHLELVPRRSGAMP